MEKVDKKEKGQADNRYRTRYFTDSGIIGSKEYVRQNCKRFKRLFQAKRERKPTLVSGLAGVYSLRRLG